VSCSEHLCREERRRLEHIIERLLKLIEFLLVKRNGIAVSAKGEVMPKTVSVGQPSTFTFTEFDGPNGTGNKGPASGPIEFASDNPAVATVDGNQQVVNADGSVSVAVVAVSAGVANITGVDRASKNQVAAGDTLTVTGGTTGFVALSATGVLS
jgi:hypothetical protein